ncbi:MAG TPA: hypothetical protein VFN26_02820 [Candidatus Acidoferrum sp.]|nr:hypothetical protein [Candidatus Acidoferrum sp.]
MPKIKVAGETPEGRFRRLGTARTNEILNRLKILGNCANRQLYAYTEKDVDKIFSVIDRRIKEVRAKFHFGKSDNFRL